MRGILSSTPSPGAIRLLVGSEILLLIQAWLVLHCSRVLHGMLPFVVGGIAIVGAVSLLLAIIGEPNEAADDHRPSGRRTSGRWS